jgi:hypothetical protein
MEVTPGFLVIEPKKEKEVMVPDNKFRGRKRPQKVEVLPSLSKK